MEKIKRIAVVVSHPIQHFCPQYASWAKCEGVVLKVFFGSNLGAQTYFDKDFKETISWNTLYLDQFDHEFLNGEATLAADERLGATNLPERLDDFKPTLVIHYGYFQLLARQAYKWAIANRIQQGYISDAEFRQHRPVWKRLLKYPYLFLHFKKIDHFLTVGNANEAYYRFYGVAGKKMKRMHFPIDINTYEKAWQQKESLRKSFRDRHLIDDDTTVLSVVGKLVAWKSQDHLIQLLHILEKEQPQKKFCLLIAGSGPEEKSWKEQVGFLQQNKINFLGFVKPEELPAIYAASDVYVHPALREPHSLSISEAVYMGCPAIIADTCGSWGDNDDVQDNKNGYVFKYADLEDLKAKLMLACREEKRTAMSTYAHRIAVAFQSLAHGKVLNDL